MSDRAFALRFISGKYQGGEFPLQESGELVMEAMQQTGSDLEVSTKLAALIQRGFLRQF